ncbi:MAG: 2-isopropylmalate synthase, partial [Actinomycetes bacterium]
QHGVLRKRETYEIMDPTAVGFSGSDIVLGKHSGRAAFRHALQRIGVELDETSFDRVFARMKQVADQSGIINDTRLRAIVDEVVSDSHVVEAINGMF